MSFYLWGKEKGLDYAEFYLRHIHPTQNEAEKDLLRAAADVIRDRKLVAQMERKAGFEKAKQAVKDDGGTTPETDLLYAQLPSTCDTAGDAQMARKLGDHARQIERRAQDLRAALKAVLPPLEMYAAYGWRDPDNVMEYVRLVLERTAPKEQP